MVENPPMRMKIAVLPNGVRVRTNKPYINSKLGQWQAPVMVVSLFSGARPAIIPLKLEDGLTVDVVWDRIHRAAVLGVCEAYKIDPDKVQHVTSRSMSIESQPVKLPSFLKPGYVRPDDNDRDDFSEPTKRGWWRRW
jgi:hypothetical protein